MIHGQSVAFVGVDTGSEDHMVLQEMKYEFSETYHGRKATLSIIDDWYDESSLVPEKAVQPKYRGAANQPMKQNGRSASYLGHDKTKSHSRRHK